jgi:hypothetical protein
MPEHHEAAVHARWPLSAIFIPGLTIGSSGRLGTDSRRDFEAFLQLRWPFAKMDGTDRSVLTKGQGELVADVPPTGFPMERTS